MLHSLSGGAPGAGPGPSLDFGSDIGAALKAAREHRGLSLEDISDATRIRQAYLAAIEDMRLEDLPSRPFVVGYLRAYAQVLKLDDEAVVARFRAEHGETGEPLREPVGVRRERDPRLVGIAVAGVLIVAAIGAWNVARHAMTKAAPGPATTAETPPPPPAPAALVSLGEPLPAPVESTTPAPYVTPGLADAAAGDGSAAAVAAAAQARLAANKAAVSAAPAAAAQFHAKGPVYGAVLPGPTVILQARHPALLVVSGDNGKIYFARQLAEGEAYRAPVAKGVLADVSDPAAFAVYVDGVLTGGLPATKSPVIKLVPAAALAGSSNPDATAQ